MKINKKLCFWKKKKKLFLFKGKSKWLSSHLCCSFCFCFCFCLCCCFHLLSGWKKKKKKKTRCWLRPWGCMYVGCFFWGTAVVCYFVTSSTVWCTIVLRVCFYYESRWKAGWTRSLSLVWGIWEIYITTLCTFWSVLIHVIVGISHDGHNWNFFRMYSISHFGSADRDIEEG